MICHRYVIDYLLGKIVCIKTSSQPLLDGEIEGDIFAAWGKIKTSYNDWDNDWEVIECNESTLVVKKYYTKAKRKEDSEWYSEDNRYIRLIPLSTILAIEERHPNKL